MKEIFIDAETTGTDSEKHALVQLAGVIKIDGMVKETFDFKIRPVKGQMLDPKALEVNKLTREILETYPDPRIQFCEVEALFSRYIDKFNRKDKAHFLGWNADFDGDFVREFLMNNHPEHKDFFGSWFYYPILDICKIAGYQLREIRHQFDNFRLLTVAQHLGIDFNPDDAHDAAFDIDLTMKIHDMCLMDSTVPLKSRYRPIAERKEAANPHW